MKIKWSKAYWALRAKDKLPRKVKKVLLGRKIGSATLNKMVKSIICSYRPKTMFEMPEFNHDTFCPKCGCKSMHGTGNMAHYPEHWERFNCDRCGYLVGNIDNSPFYHVLEFGGDWLI